MKKSCNEFKLEVEISADLQKGGCLSNASYIPIAKARGFTALSISGLISPITDKIWICVLPILKRRLADAGPRFKSWVIDSDGLGSNALDRVLENRRVPR